MKQAMQILSDNLPQNDTYGSSSISKALQQYQDLTNSVIALTMLGQPDYVMETLQFNGDDIVPNDGESKERLVELATKLALETLEAVRTLVPDSTEQVQRLEAAKAHIQSLRTVSAPAPPPPANAKAPDDLVGKSDVNGSPDNAVASENHEEKGTETLTALSFLLSHISLIDHSSSQWIWGCDGRTPDGKRCPNELEFKSPFYQRTFCSNRDFCGDCMARLRAPRLRRRNHRLQC